MQRTMRRALSAAGVLAIAAAGAAWSGCGEDDEERVQEAIDQAQNEAEDLGQEAEEAAEQAGEEAKRAADEGEKALEEAGEEAEKAADDVGY